MKDSDRLQLTLSILTAIFSVAVFAYTISSIYRLNSQPDFSIVFIPHSQLAQVISPLDTDPNLVGWWKFDEGSGTNAGDSSGKGNNGTLINSPTWTTDKAIGTGAVSFDGVNDEVDTNLSSFQVSAFSVNVWVKLSPSDYLSGNSIVGKYISSSHGIKVTEARAAGIDSFQCLLDSVTAYAGVVIDDNRWHMVTCAWNGSVLTPYTDGVPASGVPATTLTDTATFSMGKINGNAYYKGLLDDVRLYSKALTSDEISQLYAQGGGAVSPVNSSYGLNITKAGTGTGVVSGGSISCGSICSQANITSGTQITLTAAPDANVTVSWQGCTSSTATTCTVTMNANTTVTATFTLPAGPVAINNGLIAYYMFEEGSGNTAGDSSWNNNTLSFVGTPLWTTGKIGRGLSFDGIHDYLTTSKDFIGTTPITFCSWIYATGDVGQRELISNGQFIVGFGSDHISVTNNSSSYAPSASYTPPLNLWQHVCVTRDLQGLVNIYVNGILSGGANQYAGLPVPGSIGVRLGALDWSQFFPGHMDDVRIYSRVLSASEVSALYNSASPGAPSQSQNRAPVVSTGVAKTVILPNAATLAGVVTDDGLPTGSSLTTTWSMISGPAGGIVTFGNPHVPSTTATFSQAGNYVLQLTASDSQYTVSAVLPITVEVGPSAVPYISCGTDCYQASTVSIPDVSAAIDASQAANGGIVKIPAGTATFTSSLSKIITKDLIITGAGQDKTIINDAYQVIKPIFGFTVNGNVAFHIMNMRINQAYVGNMTPGMISLGGSSYRVMVSDIYFDMTGMNSGRALVVGDPNSLKAGGGVVYNNTFYSPSGDLSQQAITVDGSLLGISDHSLMHWDAQDPQWGSPFKWYIEDNVINFSGQGDDGIELYDGAHAVVRHNTIIATGIGLHGYDSDVVSSQDIEVYNNTFTSPIYVGALFAIRGGTALLWGNTFNEPQDEGFQLIYYRSVFDQLSPRCNGTVSKDGNWDSTGYPCYEQPGMTGMNGLTPWPIIQWNNTYHNSQTNVSGYQFFDYNSNAIPLAYGGKVTTSPTMFDHVKEGRDYINGETTCSGGLDHTKPWVADAITVSRVCAAFWDPINKLQKNYTPLSFPHPLRSNSQAQFTYVAPPTPILTTTVSPQNPYQPANNQPNTPAQNQGGANNPNQPNANNGANQNNNVPPANNLPLGHIVNRLAATFRFTRSLSLGQSNISVKSLQIFLNDHGFTVTPTITGHTPGAGSLGHESTYFGPATKRALIKFQEYYASEILTPVHLVKGTGYFGPSTIKKVNGLISSNK